MGVFEGKTLIAVLLKGREKTRFFDGTTDGEYLLVANSSLANSLCERTSRNASTYQNKKR